MRMKGFTLIEAVLAIAVIAILLVSMQSSFIELDEEQLVCNDEAVFTDYAIHLYGNRYEGKSKSYIPKAGEACWITNKTQQLEVTYD